MHFLPQEINNWTAFVCPSGFYLLALFLTNSGLSSFSPPWYDSVANKCCLLHFKNTTCLVMILFWQGQYLSGRWVLLNQKENDSQQHCSNNISQCSYLCTGALVHGGHCENSMMLNSLLHKIRNNTRRIRGLQQQLSH